MTSSGPVQHLSLTDATAETIRPYGRLISTRDPSARLDLRFYQDTVEVGAVEGFRSDDKTELSIVKVQPRPLELRYLERHFLHTQVFLPLSGTDYIVALGRPDCDAVPEPSEIKAFRIPGDTGLLLHIGTWHEFPFPLGGTASMVVILRSETTRDLTVDANNSDEAIGPDIEKRSLARRWPTSITITC
jgi:ureidoglycolate lyase